MTNCEISKDHKEILVSESDFRRKFNEAIRYVLEFFCNMSDVPLNFPLESKQIAIRNVLSISGKGNIFQNIESIPEIRYKVSHYPFMCH